MHVQSNTLLLGEVFENFQNMCLEIYKLNPAKFFPTTGLARKAALKTTKVKLDLLVEVNMLLMVQKGIRGEICHSIYRFAKTNNKYRKDYDKNKGLSYIKYWDLNNLYRWAMAQKFPVNNFEWFEETSQFNEDFIKKTIIKKK